MRTPSRTRQWWLLLPLLLASCADDDPAHTITASIDRQGGSLALEDVEIRVPPGAVTETTRFTLRRSSDAPPAGYTALSRVFVFEPEGLSFAQPVLVTLQFQGDAEGATVLWTQHGSETAYTPIGGSIVGQRITASVDHFSRGLVGRALGSAKPDAAPEGGIDGGADGADAALADAAPGDLATVDADRDLTAADGAALDASADATTAPATVTREMSFPQDEQRAIDLLFVIDNSGSMGEEQQLLADSFPALIDGLRDPRFGDDPDSGAPCTAADPSGCRIPDVHIGVVTTDLGAGNYNLDRCSPGGDLAQLQNTPRVAGCTPPTDRFISYADGTTNIPGGDGVAQVAEAFSCIAKVGTGGCGFEHTLEAMRLALDVVQTPQNAGFLRDSAALAVVLITDEDDCSAAQPQLFDPAQSQLTDFLGPLNSFRCFEFGISCDVNDRMTAGVRNDCHPAGAWLHDIADYVTFLEQLRPWGRLVLAAIAGIDSPVEVGLQDGQPTLLQSCQSVAGLATPGIRIKALTEAMSPNGQFSSICEGDFEPAMRSLATGLLDKLSAQCLSAPLATTAGGLACQQGDSYGATGQCQQSCLHEADCQLNERVGTAAPTTIPRCPTALWYPADWETERDCQTAGACPCWRLVKKDAGAAAGKRCDPDSASPYALDILRQSAAATDAVAELSCQAFASGWTDAALDSVSQCM